MEGGDEDADVTEEETDHVAPDRLHGSLARPARMRFSRYARRVLNRLLFPLIADIAHQFGRIDERLDALEAYSTAAVRPQASLRRSGGLPGAARPGEAGEDRRAAAVETAGTLRLCVLFHPRCGSSWLINRLQNVDGFHVRGEIFAPVHFEKHGYRPPEELMGAVWDHAERIGAPVAGFKVAPYQIIEKQRFLKTMAEQRVATLALWREDLLDAVVSQARAKHLASIGRDPNLRVGQEGLGPILVTREEFVSCWVAIERDRNDVRLIESLLSGPTTSLTYEEMVRDPEAASRVLTNLLQRPVEVPSDTTIAKLTVGGLEAAVSNAGEVRAWAAELGLT